MHISWRKLVSGYRFRVLVALMVAIVALGALRAQASTQSIALFVPTLSNLGVSSDFNNIMAANVDSPGNASSPVSDGGVTPYIIAGSNPGGNRTCAEVGTAFFGDPDYYQFASETFEEGDQFGGTAGPITWSTIDETYVAWAGLHGGLAVIVKGGQDANVYVYDGTWQADSGLASPPTGNEQTPTLSNITFCWNPAEEPPVCDWVEETAWVAGNRYVARGNWATYTPYVADSTVTLYAGQTMPAGTVHFSAVSDGEITITIELNAGWRFEEVIENVKIQDYASAPSGNPAPGRFQHKGDATGSTFAIVVPANNYYGVHVNVEWEDCDED